MDTRRDKIDTEDNLFLNKKMKKLDIIAFRGDNRPPEVVFTEGFTRRGGTWEHFNTKKEIEEPTFRFFATDYKGKQKAEDIIPSSAVCVTKKFDLAPLFPIENPENPNDPVPPVTWIYIVKVQQGFLTYDLQRQLNSSLAFCEEVATRDIPPGDVICAVKCERFWNVDANCAPNWENGMHYKLMSDVIWNPNLKTELVTDATKNRDIEILKLFEEKRGKYWECPIPSQKDGIEPLKHSHEISDQTHSDMLHLMQFAVDMDDANKVNYNKKQKQASALAHLTQCSDLNMFIPGMNMTPLMHACATSIASNNHEIIDYLLSNGASPAIVNSKNETVIDYANHPETQLQLMKFKASQANQYPLNFALQNNDEEMVEAFLENRIETYIGLCKKLLNIKNIDENIKLDLVDLKNHLKKYLPHVSVKNAKIIDNQLNLLEAKLDAIEIDIDIHKINNASLNKNPLLIKQLQADHAVYTTRINGLLQVYRNTALQLFDKMDVIQDPEFKKSCKEKLGLLWETAADDLEKCYLKSSVDKSEISSHLNAMRKGFDEVGKAINEHADVVNVRVRKRNY